jgi:hypothetical protein
MAVLNLRAAVAISLINFAAAGCASPPEEAVLAQFFAAARLRDHTALASFATITFEPHVDGIVTEFDVTHVTAEQRTGFARPAASQARDEAKDRDLILQLSINIRPDVDLTKHDGQLGSKELTIEAPVRLPAGGIVQRTLIVTIQHAVLKADPEIVGRWIVTGLRVSSDSRRT